MSKVTILINRHDGNPPEVLTAFHEKRPYLPITFVSGLALLFMAACVLLAAVLAVT